MANATNKRGIIRWEGFYILATLGAFAVVYYVTLFDFHLKKILESYASGYNGAAVNLGRIDLSLFRQTFHLTGIRVSDPADPRRNMVELDSVEIAFQTGQLLRKKLQIDDLRAEGIRYDTVRDPLDVVSEAETAGVSHSGLTERVAQGFFASIRDEIGENPLRHLAPLVHGFDLATRVDKNLKELRSHQKALEVRERSAKMAPRWAADGQTLPKLSYLAEARKRIETALESERSPTSESIAGKQQDAEFIRDALQAERAKVGVIHKQMTSEYASLRADTQSIDGLIEQDIKKLAALLKLPHFATSDLTPALLGPTILTYLERTAYWVDLSRRRMRKGVRQGVSVQRVSDHWTGTNVEFGKMSTNPRFLLEKATLVSSVNRDKANGEVTASLTGVTSDPPIFGKPMTIAINADFPEQRIKGFNVEGQVDHTQEVSREHMHLGVTSLPVKKMSLAEGELSFGISDARAAIDADVDFDDAGLKSQGVIKFTGVKFYVNSSLKELDQAVRNITDRLEAFQVRFSAVGPYDRIKFNCDSELGLALARGLRGVFRFQFDALDDDLRKEILDAVHPIRETARRQIADLDDKYLGPVDATYQSLQELERYADKAITHLGDRNKRLAKTPAAKRRPSSK